MKKLIMIVLLGMFMINLSSSFEFDNWVNYENNDMRVRIVNAFNMGEELGTAELKSHKSVNEILEVAPGNNRVVMYYDFNFNEIYENGLGGVEFTNVTDGKKINKDYYFVIWDTIIEEKNNYSKLCNKINNQTGIYTICESILKGTYQEEKDGWVKLKDKDIPKGKVRIGLATDVNLNDTIDGVWNIAGKEIKRHAVWTGNLNVGLVSYYKLNGTSGVVVDSLKLFDGTNNGAVRGVDGIINNSFNFSAGNTEYVFIGNPLGASQDFTFNVWFNTTTTAGESTLLGHRSNDGWRGIAINNGVLNIVLRNPGSGTLSQLASGGGFNDGEWHMVTMRYSTTTDNFTIYIDSVLENSDVVDITPDPIDYAIGRTEGQASGYFNGKIDEVGVWNRSVTDEELVQLWNGGVGISWANFSTIPPTVTLNSPTDNQNFTSQDITFNCTASDDELLVNVSVYIDGVINETNSSGINGVNYIFTETLSEGLHNWTCDAWDNSSFQTIESFQNFTIDSILPSIIVESPIGTFNYNLIGGNETLNVTFTDTNLNTCWFGYNGTNITIDGCLTGVKNSTLFILEINNLNMTIYANDTFGNENSTFIDWDYKILELNRTFESSVFETDSQTFSINVSANSSLSSVNLIYDGTSKSTTLSNNISTITFDIPTSTGSKEFFWSFNYAGEVINSSSSNQTVDPISFDFCNATLTTPYINFTFKNETTNEESINATIISIWDVWLGGGTVSKTFTLTNSTENINYDICFDPSEETINTNVTLNYNNVDSQQRSFASEPILTNSTTQQVLFLLPSSLGLFSQFQTRDIANNPISLVKGTIKRTLGSGIITVASFFTDSSGIVVYFLNPDVIYTATFSKGGFIDNTFTFVPTTDLRFVTMGTGVTVNGSDISIGTLYEITPIESTLTNNTLTTFGFNVTGNTEITFISMNITDGNGTSFGFDSTSGLGFISLIINTSSNATLTGIFEIRTDEENLTISKIWVIGNEFEGDYSISKQGKLYLQYEFSDFIRLAMVIFIMFGVVIFMSSNELADNNESKIAVVILMIWGFSVIGWLNNPAVVSTTGIAQYARQYGIAILSTAGTLFFFMRRIFV